MLHKSEQHRHRCRRALGPSDGRAVAPTSTGRPQRSILTASCSFPPKFVLRIFHGQFPEPPAGIAPRPRDPATPRPQRCGACAVWAALTLREGLQGEGRLPRLDGQEALALQRQEVLLLELLHL